MFVLVLLTCLSAVFACAKKDPDKNYVTVSDLPQLASVQADGTLYFEWLRSYDPDKPTLVVFHGEESAESVFTINLSRRVYTNDVLVSTAGYKGVMPTDKQKSYFDIGYFWTDIAGYNVAVFHWERFADESDTESIVAKIFSPYKSRYKSGGEYKENVFPVSLSITRSLHSSLFSRGSCAISS